jgi:putative hydrolase of HD superfamily
MPEDLQKQLDFIIEIDKMKTVYRQTMTMDGSRAESDAEHSWHFAMAALLLQRYAARPIDINRVVQMALVHDLVEIYAGDTCAYDTVGYADKEQREKEAADKLFALLPAEQGLTLRLLWEEFDQMQTADALYASALDRLMPFLSNLQTQGYTWLRHNVSAEQIYTRLRPIQHAVPALWDYIEENIQQAKAKGYVK